MANRSISPLKSTAASSFGSVDKFIRLKLSAFDNSSNAWQGRFEILKKPRVLISLFLATSAFYCFAIGRDRYTSVSEFVIQQAAPLETSSASVLAGAAAAPQVLTSLVDGQYLQVYLASSEVKNRLFPNSVSLEKDYKQSFPDVFSGLSTGSSSPQQLSFYRKQLQISPQPLSGSVIIRTVGYAPEQAFSLNQSLILQSRRFVNEVNQSINADQNIFAKKEVELAENNLKEASRRLEIFQDKFGQLNVASEQAATSSFISELESRLVDSKVEEATLRRQYRDPNAPEVSFVADQVRELEKQITKERQKSVSEYGSDLNSLAIQESSLLSNVEFATESLQSARLAADNSRRESQRQLKFVVMLSQPQRPVAPDQNWRWQVFLGSIGIIVVAWGVGGFILAAMKEA
ncbi:possible ABC transporter involved in polysaccharide efflux [Synechococcus sp. CC9902]|uniref:sugar ABC transporter n=1 Tax=Synechococcus sp. (strain CC9902) TaxID=316279 RepID=UPI00005D3F07|nr:sugar ABC transporter [Synechococcus sp. CC9902]ABB25600.1 possible ABC transporter involved in polysaccharide efflux [Synechococcus sp. CC9902]